MSKNKRINDDTYYGDLPSNYLINLGKEALSRKLQEEKTHNNIKNNTANGIK